MTEAPRSLKLPVGENHSSLNRAGAPRQPRETSGVKPSPIVIGSGPQLAGRLRSATAIACRLIIISRPIPGSAVIMSGPPESARHRGVRSDMSRRLWDRHRREGRKARDRSAWRLATLVGRKWSLALKVHPVVQDACDFDRALRRGPVHQEMTSTTAAPCDVHVRRPGRISSRAFEPATSGPSPSSRMA